MNVRQRRLEMQEAMRNARALQEPTFKPHKLLDTLISTLRLRNDAELCRQLEVPPPVVSKIRHRRLAVGATMLLRMHEESGISIKGLKDLLAESLCDGPLDAGGGGKPPPRPGQDSEG